MSAEVGYGEPPQTTRFRKAQSGNPRDLRSRPFARRDIRRSNLSRWANAIMTARSRGDIVLAGFLGSGTTVIAVECTDRCGHGIETDPLHVNTILPRCRRSRWIKPAA
jgi:hypothetical protein